MPEISYANTVIEVSTSPHNVTAAHKLWLRLWGDAIKGAPLVPLTPAEARELASELLAVADQVDPQ